MRILVTGGGGFIGTNFTELALASGYEVLDLSLNSPLNPAFEKVWTRCDILDRPSVTRLMSDFQPDAVIHLAARADCDESVTIEEGYRANTDGTANVLAAVSKTPTVRRLIITSSQYVCGPGRQPTSDEDYFPATVYGQSKVITEQLTRSADLNCSWTIVRPTNVWGPWHVRYAKEFWKIAKRGLYVHPGGAPVVRSYAYVGTVVEQMLGLLQAPTERVDRQTFYTTDAPDDIYAWANAFCVALGGRPARRVPRAVLTLVGLGGDLISTATRKPFYITSSRVRSMVTSYETPCQETFDVVGPPTHSLKDGVCKTVEWLRTEVKEFGGKRAF
jgi:nucleoside-diphosphate-sugar epimerase